MSNDKTDDAILETYLDAARREAPLPTGDFLARIEAEALRLQPAPASPGKAPVRATPARRFLGGLGGWAGVSALAACVVVGLGLGFSQPTTLDVLSSDYAETDDLFVEDFFWSFDAALMEG